MGIWGNWVGLSFTFTLLFSSLPGEFLYANTSCGSVVEESSRVPEHERILFGVRVPEILLKLESDPELGAVTFGPEFTFTNHKILEAGNEKATVRTEENMAKFNEVKAALSEQCAGGKCQVSSAHDKHGQTVVVRYPDGWYFNVGIDMAVLEVQTKPSTLAQTTDNAERIQSEIFDFLAQFGIQPHERAGGGHIHMGNDIFVKKPRLFRNFFVDYSNRPELAYGVLGNHQGNGPSFAMIPEAQRRAFGLELRKFDSSREKDQTADRFVKLVHQTAYKKHPFPELFGGRFGTAPTYYQAIRFQTYLPTYEFRSFRPQASALEYIQEIQLFLLWLHHLRSTNELVPYLNPSRSRFNRQELVEGYYRLIKDIDGDWDYFKRLLPPNVRGRIPLGLGINREYQPI